MFQSAPAIDGGRNASPPMRRSGRQGFNPLPPSMAGETSTSACVIGLSWVSIRSRHRWREKLRLDGVYGKMASFNPLPPSMAGETVHHRRRRNPGMFQSAPAIDGGRNDSIVPAMPPGICFNPLPPSMAGETGHFLFNGLLDLFQSAPAIDGGRNQRVDSIEA